LKAKGCVNNTPSGTLLTFDTNHPFKLGVYTTSKNEGWSESYCIVCENGSQTVTKDNNVIKQTPNCSIPPAVKDPGTTIQSEVYYSLPMTK